MADKNDPDAYPKISIRAGKYKRLVQEAIESREYGPYGSEGELVKDALSLFFDAKLSRSTIEKLRAASLLTETPIEDLVLQSLDQFIQKPKPKAKKKRS